MFCFNVRVTINYTHKRALTHFDIESCGSLVSQGRAALINKCPFKKGNVYVGHGSQNILRDFYLVAKKVPLSSLWKLIVFIASYSINIYCTRNLCLINYSKP